MAYPETQAMMVLLLFLVVVRLVIVPIVLVKKTKGRCWGDHRPPDAVG